MTADLDYALNPDHMRCDEEVTRKGHSQPCDRPAVAIIQNDQPYPVCHPHGAGRLLVPLADLLAVAWHRGAVAASVSLPPVPNPYDRKEPK